MCAVTIPQLAITHVEEAAPEAELSFYGEVEVEESRRVKVVKELFMKRLVCT
jgi:hypothetical protein